MAQFSTAEVAAKFSTDPRTLRKFLRADARSKDNADSLPGKGARYAIEGKDLKSLQSRFTKWTAAEATARAERAAAKAQEANDAAEGPEDDEEVEVETDTED